MATTIHSPATLSESQTRAVVRDSGGRLIAATYDSSLGGIQIYGSDDDGDTWTKIADQTTSTADLNDLHIRDDDRIMAACHDGGNFRYHIFSVDASWNITWHQEALQAIGTNSDQVDGGIVATTTGSQWYTFEEIHEKVMGTNYESIYIFRYDGSGSFTQVGTKQGHYTSAAMSPDSADVIHITYHDTTNDDLRYDTFDTSSDTFGSEETIISGGIAAEQISPGVVVNDEPFLVYTDRLYRRDGGAWSSTAYTNLSSTQNPTLSHSSANSDFHIAVGDGTDTVYHASGAYADLDSSSSNQLLAPSGTESYTPDASRWQFVDTDPDPYVFDVLVHDSDSNTLLYESVGSSSAGATDTGSVTAASGNPRPSTETASTTDAGAVTTATGASTTATETTSVTDAGSLTTAGASARSSTDTAAATDTGSTAPSVAIPLTSTEQTTTGVTDIGSVTASSATPIASVETASTTDAGAVTAATGASTTATETTSATDAGAPTAAGASPLSSTDTTSATTAGNQTAATASPTTATETTVVTDTGAQTASTATPLTSAEIGSVTETGTTTAATATPLTSTEQTTAGTTDTGSMTAISAASLTGAQTTQATDTGAPTATGAQPLTSTETAATTDVGALTGVSGLPTASTDVAAATTTGSLTPAAATPLVSTETATNIAVDSGSVTAGVAAPLTATEQTAVSEAGSVTPAQLQALTSADVSSAHDVGSATAAVATPLSGTRGEQIVTVAATLTGRWALVADDTAGQRALTAETLTAPRALEAESIDAYTARK